MIYRQSCTESDCEKYAKNMRNSSLPLYPISNPFSSQISLKNIILFLNSFSCVSLFYILKRKNSMKKIVWQKLRRSSLTLKKTTWIKTKCSILFSWKATNYNSKVNPICVILYSFLNQSRQGFNRDIIWIDIGFLNFTKFLHNSWKQHPDRNDHMKKK